MTKYFHKKISKKCIFTPKWPVLRGQNSDFLEWIALNREKMGRNGANMTNRANGGNKANGTNRVRHYETLIYYTRARVGWRMWEKENEKKERSIESAARLTALREILEYPPNTQSKIARCLGNYSKIITPPLAVGLSSQNAEKERRERWGEGWEER